MSGSAADVNPWAHRAGFRGASRPLADRIASGAVGANSYARVSYRHK
jgi:hypothetical protein